MKRTCLVGVALGLSVISNAAELVVNGGFELGVYNDSSSPPGWIKTYGDVSTRVDNWYGYNIPGGGGAQYTTIYPHSGGWMGLFGSPGGGEFAQTVATTVGATYEVSFWLANDVGETFSLLYPQFTPYHGHTSFDAALNGNAVYSFDGTSAVDVHDQAWNLRSFDWTATSTSLTLSFEQKGWSNIAIDDVSIKEVRAVPEPCTAGIGFGAVGLAALRRRRRA